MSSLIKGYEYDIFISYRQKDNKADKWVTHFVEALQDEIEATFKEDISIYFDENPHDGLLETHLVDASLASKLKCLVFIPIISQTYCDESSFAWEHEFMPFIRMAKEDELGMNITLSNGNVTSRVLPIKIHELDTEDLNTLEAVLDGPLRSIDFIYSEPGVNRPLRSNDSEEKNLNKTRYRNQINKVANAIKEIISGRAGADQNDEYFSSDASTANLEDSSEPNEKSIIVLPFENMSSDPEQEYFSDGLTEEVIADLSNVHELLVISRSSAMTFKGAKNTIREMAAKVNVRYVLEGSVRKAGNDLRITAQLIDSVSDTHVWSEKYDGVLDDVFKIQENVSRSIVEKLKVKLSTDEEKLISENRHESVKVYDYYLKAINSITTSSSQEKIKQVIKELDRTIEVIGEQSILYSTLALAYWALLNIGYHKEEYIQKSEYYAQKALLMDPNSAMPNIVLGFIHLLFHGNTVKSLSYAKKAFAIDPNNVLAITGILNSYLISGKMTEAWPLVHIMEKIDPLSFITRYFQGALNYYSGRFDIALAESEKTIKMYPENSYGLFEHCVILVFNRNTKEAIHTIDKILRLEQGTIFDKLASVLKYALVNMPDKMNKALTKENEDTISHDMSYASQLAGFFCLADAKEKAYYWLEKSINAGFINYPFLNTYCPLYENIRHEKRFKQLMKKVKHEWENFEV